MREVNPLAGCSEFSVLSRLLGTILPVNANRAADVLRYSTLAGLGHL